MRVISGTARRIQLKTIEGLDTRPTTDRIKETLFNMLNTQLSNCIFLDLFSGSGAIGIEALSRGADLSVFVEKNYSAVSCIKSNLKATRLEEKAQILSMDASSALKNLENSGMVFDIIFMDPPYQSDEDKKVLEYLNLSSLIDENSMIILETSLNKELTFLEGTNLRIFKKKEYKTNMHVFIERIE